MAEIPPAPVGRVPEFASIEQGDVILLPGGAKQSKRLPHLTVAKVQEQNMSITPGQTTGKDELQESDGTLCASTFKQERL